MGRPRVREQDEERGSRIARLRVARGFATQRALLDDVAGRVERGELAAEDALDRVEYQRVEKGENRLTSETLQRRLATVFGVPRPSLDAYAKGELELDALLGGGAQVAAPVPAPRQVVLDDEHEHRPAALALMRGKFDREVIDAVRLLKTRAEQTLTVADWWDEARRLQAMRDGLVRGEDHEPSDAPDVSPDRLHALANEKRPKKTRAKGEP